MLTLITHTGTGGGQGYIVEYRGQAIEELSMEARMTVCNMSIEWGAKAGLIAPDQTTFDYIEGRPEAPTGADWDAAVEHWKTLRTDDDAVFDKEIVPRRLDDDAVRHLGHQPRPGRAARRRRARPRRLRGRRGPGRRRERPAVHGPRGRHADARGQGRHRLRRLLHQRPHRGPAPRRRHHQGPPRRQGHPAARRARLGAGAPAGRGRGPRRDLQGGRRRVARRGLLDVPGHEPRPARARRAQRLDLQPQLRGPAGQGRSHPPGVRAGRRRHRRSAARSRRPPTSSPAP